MSRVEADDRVVIGVVGTPAHARVGTAGTISPRNVSWSLDWWIGADDRWHVPVREAAVRQALVEGMPVVRTAMRIPGGDAVAVVAAVPEPVAVAVLDVTDDSPAAFALALVIRDACAVEVDGTSVFLDGRRAVRLLRGPSRWAAGTPETVEQQVVGGDAEAGEFPVVHDPAGGACVALLFPVAHRTTFRAAVALDPRGISALDPAALPSADAVARGWRAQLGRGLRVELPETALQDAVDSARASVLVAAQQADVAPATVAALEDWGFDAEARQAWAGLGRRARKEAGHRDGAPESWDALRSAAGSGPIAASELLLGVRAALLQEHGDVVDLFPRFPADWTGAPLDLRDAPTGRGPVSCSVRWHGPRPALLWDVPAGVTVRASGLDRAWSSSEPTGEVLLEAGPSGSADAHGSDA